MTDATPSRRRLTIATGPLLPVPAVSGGSVHRMWELLAAQFVPAGWQVTLAARRWPGQPDTEIRDGVHYQRWGGFAHSPSLPWNLLRDLAYATGLRGRLPDAELLVVNDVMLPLLARRRSGRMLVSVNRFPKGQLRLWRRADLLVAPSRSIQQAIIDQQPAAAARTVLIPNAFPLAEFANTGDNDQRRPGSILYVGRLHPEKGLKTLLAAMAVLQQTGRAASLTLVGPHEQSAGGGGAAFLEQLRQLADGLQVRFVGPVFDRAALARLYAQHQLFCYPSAAEAGEAAPVAPLEAMAAGCVPVLAALDCYRDVLVEGRNSVLFDHHRADAAAALALCLQTLLESADTRERLAAQARIDARAFDVPAIATRWLQAFADLCPSPGR